tara:strand:- start:106 stop:816 length:711 start_codon:yes stop_codon:yes gene_type:complete
MINVGIAIPAYNEEKNIIKLINKINKLLKCYIIIVDDSNNQHTEKLIKKLKKDNLFYIHRKKRLGRGSAVIEGLKELYKKKKIRYFIEMDSDFSHRPSEINRNLNIIKKENLDLLIGSRYLSKSKIINWPIKRRTFSHLSNFILEFLFKLKINDYTNGFRFYSRRAVKTLISKKKFISNEFLILSEVLIILKKKKFSIKEIESIFINRIRGKSSVNISLIVNSFTSMIKLFWKYKI